MKQRSSISRRQFIGSVAAGSALGLTGCMIPKGKTEFAAGLPPAGPSRPNFIVLVSDDHRYNAMGCMGNPVIETPNLDWLAEDGTLFTNAFCTTSICCSSRASILTGLYTTTHGIAQFDQDLSPRQFDLSYTAQLRQAGYRTGFVGKYGIGTTLPEDEFDFWGGMPGQPAYFNEIDGEIVHSTDYFGGKALEFIQTNPDDQPFCLSVSFKAGHTMDYDPNPWQPAPRFESLYRDAQMPVPDLATEEHYDKLPDFLKDSEGRRRWKNRFITPERYQETVRDYYRVLTGMDEAIGLMMETLKAKGIADNTVIVYLSDNGFLLGERGLAGKWYAHEESIRIPMIIHDPRMPATSRGASRGQMALTIDIAPTILDLAGMDVPGAMQGHSLAPIMRDNADGRAHWFYEHPFEFGSAGIPRSEGVRTERWKYIRWVQFDPSPEELYDLDSDPFETNNLVDDPDYQDRLNEMRGLWKHYKETLPRPVA